MSYIKEVWEARFISFYLAKADLNSKWRRSFFGILWSIVQPLGMTLLLSFIFSRLFNQNMQYYAPYIFSGVITWEYIVSTTQIGSLCFIHSALYIKQCRQPLAIYSLRIVLTALFIFILNSVILGLWVLFTMPENFNASWLSIIAIYPVILFIAWPLTTFLGYVGTRFRDLAPALALVMQALWLVSPIYFEEKMFKNNNLTWLVDYNPIYHVLQLIRAPLFSGTCPTMYNYLACVLVIIFVSLMAIVLGYKFERHVIFYL